jgi:hypothetical protein
MSIRNDARLAARRYPVGNLRTRRSSLRCRRCRPNPTRSRPYDADEPRPRRVRPDALRPAIPSIAEDEAADSLDIVADDVS